MDFNVTNSLHKFISLCNGGVATNEEVYKSWLYGGLIKTIMILHYEFDLNVDELGLSTLGDSKQGFPKKGIK